ncbi:MAG: FHA domain-containing protein, partial [Xanthomonadales bacterium]|nr:FHA domain-containing protein [Xanthomonadales bacterium]
MVSGGGFGQADRPGLDVASHCVIHRLKLHLPAGPSAEHRLPAHIRWQLGRDPGCDVQIDHPSVSRRHARLEGD